VANGGVGADAAWRGGLTTLKGKVVNPAVAAALGLEAVDPAALGG
jgi:alanine dehydrogenase